MLSTGTNSTGCAEMLRPLMPHNLRMTQKSCVPRYEPVSITNGGGGRRVPTLSLQPPFAKQMHAAHARLSKKGSLTARTPHCVVVVHDDHDAH
eukprot:3203566-Rhodomonas_salina.1